ncbi:MAG: hypothetical protein ACNS60_15835 [Candidatus Cyclobacteriaceae bacterium M2_1C_046]
MNLTSIELSSVNRLIAHEIYPKTKSEEPYAKTTDSLLEFSASEKTILINRLSDALQNSNKTFQLEYEDEGSESIYYFLSRYDAYSEPEFIHHSKGLADKLAEAHFRVKIPGGFCLIGDGLLSTGESFFFIIKAELQEVFNIKNNQLNLIRDVFLSPAKDFYKIGFFLKRGSSYLPFMYDDQFSLQKKDLTEYFYGKFLGLTTDKNDKLRAKNFYEDTKLFIDANIENIKDRLGLLKALHVLYREESSGIISPRNFSDSYFEGELKRKFDKKVVEQKYPQSFTKDISLINRRLDIQRVSIPLSFTLSIVGRSEEMDNVDIINNPTSSTLDSLQPEIDNGNIGKIVVLRQKFEG